MEAAQGPFEDTFKSNVRACLKAFQEPFFRYLHEHFKSNLRAFWEAAQEVFEETFKSTSKNTLRAFLEAFQEFVLRDLQEHFKNNSPCWKQFKRLLKVLSRRFQ